MTSRTRVSSSGSSLRQSLGLPRRVEAEGGGGEGIKKRSKPPPSAMPPRSSLAAAQRIQKRPASASHRRLTAEGRCGIGQRSLTDRRPQAHFSIATGILQLSCRGGGESAVDVPLQKAYTGSLVSSLISVVFCSVPGPVSMASTVRQRRSPGR